MKIALYLQDTNQSKMNPKEFNKQIEKVKKADIDLLVFPEFCYTPFANDLWVDITSKIGYSQVENFCIELCYSIGCAIIFSSKDKHNVTFSMYVNALAENEETYSKLYIKHTATDYSAFDFNDYKEKIDTMFQPITYKGHKIGMTICYDCNHSLFSRKYGEKGIDILINSTGGNVNDDKWHKYNKVRAIENHCFNFCTMGYTGNYKNVDSFVYGYTPTGKSMEYIALSSKKQDRNDVGTIYVYDTDMPCEGAEVDKSIEQRETVNKFEHFYFPCGDANKLISASMRVDDNLYVYNTNGYNIILCLLNEKEIFAPEKVSQLIYNTKLKAFDKKKYLLINQWSRLDDSIYKNQLSDVLKVRSMENYCAVLLESDIYNKCYQCGNNRTAQVVKMVNGKYGLDLDRTTGPETIWKNKDNMKASWRYGYELLTDSFFHK